MIRRKKKNNANLAIQAVYAGSFFTIAALIIFTRTGGPITFDERTGVVGDTIGGIAGPILNITGLLVVYYSLKEQYKANRNQSKQLKEEIKRNRNERDFDITYRLFEIIIQIINNNHKELSLIADIEYNLIIYKSRGLNENIVKEYEHKIENTLWIIHDLQNHYLLIKNRLLSNNLTLSQKEEIIILININYWRRLLTLKNTYNTVFGKDFSIKEDIIDIRPRTLCTTPQKLDSLGGVC